MRLLYLMTEPFGVGGVQSDILTLTEDLSKRGHTVYVATTPGVLLDELKGKGARHVNVDFNYRGPAGLARAVAALQRVVREEAIELVAPQSMRSTIATWTALRLLSSGSWVAASGRRVPVVTTIHNIHNPANFRYAGHILQRCCDYVIFESHYERNRVLASGLDERSRRSSTAASTPAASRRAHATLSSRHATASIRPGIACSASSRGSRRRRVIGTSWRRSRGCTASSRTPGSSSSATARCCRRPGAGERARARRRGGVHGAAARHP